MSSARRFLARHGTTLALTLAAVGAGAYYALVARDAPTTAELEKRKRNLFSVWRRDAITGLEVSARGATAKLTIVGGEVDSGIRPWLVELGGVTHPASEQMVDQLLGTLEFATFEREVREASVRAEAKLDAPRVVVAVTMGSDTVRLRVGGPAPTPSGAVYAEVEGRGLYVITGQLAAALDIDVPALRSRRLVPYLSTELSGLSLEGEGGTRPLVRAPWKASRGGAFRFDGSTAEGQVRADAEVFDRMLGALGGLDAEVFLPDDPAKLTTPPRVVVTMSPSDGREKGVLALGGPCPASKADDKPAGGAKPVELALAVRRSPRPAAACVNKASLDALLVPLEQWVDRAPVAARFDEVTELTVRKGSAAIELARTGTAFHLRKPVDRMVDGEIGTDVLERLLAARATSVRPSAAADALGDPVATLFIVSLAVGQEGERVEELTVYGSNNGVALAKRSEDGAVLTLPDETVRELLPTELALRSRAVTAEKVKRARSLVVEAKGAGAERKQAFSRADDTAPFAAVEPRLGGSSPAKPPASGPDPKASESALAGDTGLVTEVLSGVCELKAVRWVADRDDGSYGTETPRFVVEVGLAADADADAGAPAPLRLLLGARTEGGTFARLASDPAVFVAPKSLEAALDRWLLDRTALLFEEADVTKLVLRAGEAAAAKSPGKPGNPPGAAELVLERKGPALRVAGKDDPTKAAVVSAAASELLADGVVTVGPAAKAQGFEAPRLVLEVTRSGGLPALTLEVGALDVLRGAPVVLVRKRGLDVTFAVARTRLVPLFEALGLEP